MTLAGNLQAFPNEVFYVLSCPSLAERMGVFTIHRLILEPGTILSLVSDMSVVMDPARGQGEV